MLYQIHNGSVMFGADTILRDINFEIRNNKEKIAIVGRNGCGKTTLLKLISGEIDFIKRDSDEDVYIAKTGNPEIGYLKQMTFEDNSLTLETEVKKVFEPIRAMQRRMDEMVEEMNRTTDPALVEKYLKDIVDQVNSENPAYKMIKKVLVRHTEFDKNTSKKIRRFVDSNKQAN